MELSGDQQRVVEHLDNCLVVAGPGSGKTRVIIKKVERILNVDRNAKILIVTFTKDSATEIRKRIIQAVPSAKKLVASGTFHSLAFSQLRNHGFTGSIMSPGQTQSFITRAIADCISAETDPDIKAQLIAIPPNEASAIIEEIKMTPGYVPINDLNGKLYSSYVKFTERHNTLDFSDILSRTVKMMQDGEMNSKDCSYIFVDEAQDLDDMQYAWCVEHIKQSKATSIETSKPASFTVVGDDDQSIYRFRRALGYEGMMRFKDVFKAPIIKLNSNYRCRAEILSSASNLICNNDERVEKKLIAERGKGGFVHAWQCENAGDEANLIVDAILKYSYSNPLPPKKKRRALNDKDEYIIDPNGDYVLEEYQPPVGIDHDEWAILARNNENLRAVVTALKSNGIPYKASVTSMWDEQPVCLALSLLESLVSSIGDGVKGKTAGFDSALHYAGFEEDIIDSIHDDYNGDYKKIIHDKNLESKYGKGSATSLSTFANYIAQWQRNLLDGHSPDLTIWNVFDWFINELGNTYAKDKDSSKYHKAFRDLTTCQTILASAKGSIQSRIRMCMQPEDDEDNKRKQDTKKSEIDVALVDHHEKHPSEGKVILGTMHSSKGLEFNNVWLMSINDGTMPSIKQEYFINDAGKKEIREMNHAEHEALYAEERRLFYVGMTRAKDRLFISCFNKPSTFIEETGVSLKSNFGRRNGVYSIEEAIDQKDVKV